MTSDLTSKPVDYSCDSGFTSFKVPVLHSLIDSNSDRIHTKKVLFNFFSSFIISNPLKEQSMFVVSMHSIDSIYTIVFNLINILSQI